VFRTFLRALAALLLIGAIAASPAQASGNVGRLTLNKVDASGALLPGATIDGWMCTFLDGEPEATCTDLTVYEWFTDGMTDTGTTDRFTSDLDMEGSFSLPISACFIFQERIAPSGHVLKDKPAVLCKGPHGWSAEDAAGLTFYLHADGSMDSKPSAAPGDIAYAGGAGDWTITNEQITSEDGATFHATVTLVNEKIPATPAPTTPTAQPATRGIGANTGIESSSSP